VLRIEAIRRARGGHERGQVVRAPPQVVQVEHTFGQPAEEARHAVLEHLAARAEQRCLRIQLPSKVEQIVLVAAGAVQQQQRGRAGGLRRNKLVDKSKL
jgi:hypothetical protein